MWEVCREMVKKEYNYREKLEKLIEFLGENGYDWKYIKSNILEVSTD